MIFASTPQAALHTLISFVAIAAGLAVLVELFRSRRADALTAVFLVTTILTSFSGFFLPADKILPSHLVGVLSLVVLAVSWYARYAKRMAGVWRTGYVVTAVISLYLNCFVLVFQLFLKVPALHELAPNMNEAPFAITQAVTLAAFVTAAIAATLRFHPATADGERAYRA